MVAVEYLPMGRQFALCPPARAVVAKDQRSLLFALIQDNAVLGQVVGAWILQADATIRSFSSHFISVSRWQERIAVLDVILSVSEIYRNLKKQEQT